MAEPEPGEAPTMRNCAPTPSDETVPASTVPAAVSDPRDAEGRPFGRYRLLSELGAGGMGVVWKAWDTQLRRVVALKTIRGEVGEDHAMRFLREAQLAAKLRHPGIVAVHDVGAHGGQHFFTADYVAGRSLAAALLEGYPVRQLVAWVAEVAEALSYAHEQGIIHRDVKPSNVLIDERGRACVTDFGLAKESSGSSGPAITGSGALLGTPRYMSPEQASSLNETLGPATDQYSLGVVLYEAIVGRTPFQEERLPRLLVAITDEDPVPPSRANPQVQRDLETICMKALEKDPARRYASMADLAADLRSWLAGEPIRARPASFADRLTRKARKHRWVVALVVVNLVVGGWAAFRAIADRGIVEERDAAREGLRKAALAQRVLGRWKAIGRTLREIEARCVDSSLTPSQRERVGATLWPDVDAFMRDTPGDPTSQATMKALVGWARGMAGGPAQGMAWIREAGRLDPDLPYGPLMEALVLLIEYKDAQPPPAVRFTSHGAEVRPPAAETERMRELRAEVDRLLDRASRASVWGVESAQDLKKAVRALQASQEGRYEEAERGLTEVLGAPTMDAFETELRFERGVARCLLGRYEEAARDLDEAAAARPRKAEAWLAVGFTRLAEGRWRDSRGEPSRGAYEAAIRACDSAIEILPTIVQAYGLRGNARSDLGEHAAAIADFDAGLRLAPGHAVLLLNRGVAKYQGGDFAGALADYDTVLQIDRRSVEALQNRGQALTDLGRYEEAIASLSESLRLLPDDLSALLNRARARLLSGDAEGCASDADSALRLQPRNVGALSLRGNARQAKEDLEGARADFDAALAIDPRHVPSLSGRGILRAARGDLEGAIADHTTAIEVAPSDARLRYTRAGYYKRHGDIDLAIAEYGEVLRLRPGDVGAIWYRSVAYELKGDLKGVVADLEQALAAASPDWEGREDARLRLQVAHYNLACEGALSAAAAAGDEARDLRERAFLHLEAAVAAGWTDQAHMEADPDLASLHDDARWKPLVDRVRNR